MIMSVLIAIIVIHIGLMPMANSVEAWANYSLHR